MSRSLRRVISRRIPVLGGIALLLGVLTWPLLFTHSGFSGDWEHHLWLMWHQSLSIQSSGYPSLFLNNVYQVFYPSYAFYGGTLYAVGGLLSLLLGGAPVSAYVLIFFLDFVAALCGWYWLARMAGVGRWLAIVPGLIFVTSAYYILVVYVQGDWPEFTGISMIPLMSGAGLSVLRADRLRLGPACALAVSAVLFFGSHNLTILLGLTTLGLIAVAVALCMPEARRQLTGRGVGRLLRITIPAAMVSAWYLLPALVYQARTHVGADHLESREALRATAGLVSMQHLFTLSRGSAVFSPKPLPYAFPLSLPIVAMAWVLAGIVLLPWGRRGRAWRRCLLICSGVTTLIIVAMTHVGLLLAMPLQYSLIQFSYRLETYVLLGLCGAIVAALALAQRGARNARVWAWLAAPVCAVSLVGAIKQVSAYPYPGPDRYGALSSYGEFEDNRDYDDESQPVIAAAGLQTLEFPLSSVHDDRASMTVQVKPGTLLATNIGAGPYLVRVDGARPVGIDSATHRMVLAVGAGNTPKQEGTGSGAVQQATITVSAGRSVPVVLGRVLTLGGAAALILQLLLVPIARSLSRRRRHSDAA